MATSAERWFVLTRTRLARPAWAPSRVAVASLHAIRSVEYIKAQHVCAFLRSWAVRRGRQAVKSHVMRQLGMPFRELSAARFAHLPAATLLKIDYVK
jgi:hypothetical protein